MYKKIFSIFLCLSFEVHGRERGKRLTMRSVLVFIVFMLASVSGFAAEEAAEVEGGRSASECAVNFGAVYAVQWGVYLLTQQDTIEEYGSWDNFFSYATEPEFDKDTFDYNIFKHAWSGSCYYLFYRHRGYSKIDAFVWTFASSLTFEFAVETYTEPPSIQDIYQTPIYGTLRGMGVESHSEKLLSTESRWAHILGDILSPLSLLKQQDEGDVSVMPVIDKEALGVHLSWRFE